ncbi:MAG: hypothetical protein ABS944_03710 [Solibacillus sp.]|uniref:hypothetical protein n=1 Tax=unclassified Solibacillus TaxID=2637870 RepID=UPI0030F511FB
MRYLKQYQSFSTITEMDAHVKKHLKQNELTKSEQAILRAISQHALSTPGVAHLKAKTIADKLNITTKTVYRSVKNMQQLQIINKLPQTKMNGIKGANIYIIYPYVPSEMSDRAIDKNCHGSKDGLPLQTTQSIFFQSFISSNKLYKANRSNAFHEKLIQLYSDWPIEQEIYEQLTQAIPQLSIENEVDYDRAKRVILEVVVRVQTGAITIHSSFSAFLIGAYNKWSLLPLKEDVQQETRKRPVPFYNWLEIRE